MALTKVNTRMINTTVGHTNRLVTATNIAAIGNSVNTADKVQGKQVWDSTNNKMKVATGSNTNSTWVDADGTNAVTPS